MHKVAVDQVTVFDLPLYHSILVDEAIYWNELNKISLTSAEQARLFVIRSLRLRGVVDESLPDEEISRNLTADLTTKLWALLFYGPNGAPEVVELDEEDSAEKKKSTGKQSTGKSRSTTQGNQSSKTLASAQSA